MGASSTKFGFLSCHRRKFNAGQHLNLCSMLVQSPDSRKNLDNVLSSDIAPGLQAVKSSCILRVRNRCKRMYAGALIPLPVPCLIPSFFMEWAIPAEDADEFEDAEAAPMEKDENLSSPSEVQLTHKVHLGTPVIGPGAVEHAPNIADSVHLLDQADDFGNEHESTALLDISTSINACQFSDCSEISTHNFPGSDTPALCLTYKLNGMADMLINHDIENREWFNEIVDSTILASVQKYPTTLLG